MKYLLAIVLLFSSGHASAYLYITGSNLLKYCELQNNKGGSCLDYVMGVKNTYDTFVDLEMVGKSMCLPVNAEAGQLVRIVTKYLQEHPKDLHYRASDLVIPALTAAFPCEPVSE